MKRAKARSQQGDVLRNFKEFCKVDLQRSKRKTKDHVWQIRRFLRFAGNDLSKAKVREYLMKFMDKAPATYAGVLKSLKVFYRDYLGRGEVVKSFKFPSIPIEPKKIPTKKEVQRFYYALKSSKARALYLVFATSGLRKKELLTTKLENLDFKERMIVPPKRQWGTKNNWVTFYNEEAEEVLKKAHLNHVVS